MKLKLSYLLLIVGVLLALPLRIIELLTFIDGKTGFSLEGDFISPILTTVLVAVVVLSIFIAYLDKSHRDIYLDRDKPLAALTIIMGGTIALYSVSDIVSAFSSSQDATFQIIVSFVGIIIGAVISYMGISLIKLNTMFSPFLSVLACIWVILHLLQLFTEYTTIISVSEHLFKLMFYVFLSLFMVAMARIWSHTQAKKGMRGAYAYGVPTVVFGLLITIPQIIAHLKGDVMLMEFVWIETIMELAITAFTAYLITYLMIRQAKDNKVETMNAEDIEVIEPSENE